MIPENVPICRRSQPSHPVTRLFPLIETRNLDAFRAVIEFLTAAGDWKTTVEVAKRYRHAPGLHWHKDLAIVSTIYIAAGLVGDPLQRRLGRLVGKANLEPANGDARSRSINWRSERTE